MDKRLLACILIIAFLLCTSIKYKHVARLAIERDQTIARLLRKHPIILIPLLFVTVSVLTIGLRGDVVALVLGGIGTIVTICQILWIEPWIRILEWQIKMLERFPWLVIAMNAFVVLMGVLLWYLTAM